MNSHLADLSLKGSSSNAVNSASSNSISINNISVNSKNVHLAGSLTSIVSLLTLIILLFMLAPQEWLNITTILSLIIFKLLNEFSLTVYGFYTFS